MLRLHLTVLTTRNETFDYEIGFQILKLKFHACSMKQTFYPLHKLISLEIDNTKIRLFKFSDRYVVVKPACVNAA